jgi:membrane protein implicated in regulation of membrane protease activity
LDGEVNVGGALTLNETLLIIALIGISVDFFLQLEFPTFVAYAALDWIALRSVELPWLVEIGLALLFGVALIAFHYAVWRKLLGRFANRVIAPDRYKSSADRVIGQTGVIRLIEGRVMVSVDGDLWPTTSDAPLSGGEQVRIAGRQGSELAVEPLDPSN